MQKLKKLFSFLKLSISRAKEQNKGFTLLELLIVIAILATLATIVVIVLNPAETLAKSRDTQRMSDLATVKSAIALYLTTVNNPSLDRGTGAARNDKCIGGTGTKTLYVSVPTTAGGGESITDITYPSTFGAWSQITTAANNAKVDGDGWIPVELTVVTGGTPLSNFPVDPTNDVSTTTGSDTSTAAIVNNGALMYRYACKKSPVGFEINARLESAEYGVGSTTNDKAAKDGGNNANLYEIGTTLDILTDQTDF